MSETKIIVCTPSEGATSTACGDGYTASLVAWEPQVFDYGLTATAFGLSLFCYGFGLIISMIFRIDSNN